MVEEIPDGSTDKMRQVVSSLEDVEAQLKELEYAPGVPVRLWQRPTYWWRVRSMKKHVRRMLLDMRLTEKVVRAAEWDMPVALTPEEARHAKKTGAPLERSE